MAQRGSERPARLFAQVRSTVVLDIVPTEKSRRWQDGELRMEHTIQKRDNKRNDIPKHQQQKTHA
jgi:hypothetical protein